MQNDVTIRVNNSKLFVEILLSSYLLEGLTLTFLPPSLFILFILFILFNLSLKLTKKQDISYTIPT